MPSFVINIDVPDLRAAVEFYTSAFALKVGRRFDDKFIELVGAEIPVYLLETRAGTQIGPAGGDVRRFERHWSPIHPDFIVDDIESAIARVTWAGAVQEGETRDEPYGKLAMFGDPFGHGFCLIEFNEQGYDAITASR